MTLTTITLTQFQEKRPIDIVVSWIVAITPSEHPGWAGKQQGKQPQLDRKPSTRVYLVSGVSFEVKETRQEIRTLIEEAGA